MDRILILNPYYVTQPVNLFQHKICFLYLGLWAYDGWSSVTTITEEIKNPEKNIPRSIMIGV